MTETTPLDVFVAHCARCKDCRATMIDDNNGYPGLCDAGLRMWFTLDPEQQHAAYTAVWPEDGAQ